jgi:hypothetical protein
MPSAARFNLVLVSAISTASPKPVSRGAVKVVIPAFFNNRAESSFEPVSTAITWSISHGAALLERQQLRVTKLRHYGQRGLRSHDGVTVRSLR